ncbi:MAG TPA: hypothetical protein PKC87_00305 [Candidatus Absconditabacterales bacterium]|nr:hypothetical protein [Candidatus Absconditabacterales bacterium]
METIKQYIEIGTGEQVDYITPTNFGVRISFADGHYSNLTELITKREFLENISQVIYKNDSTLDWSLKTLAKNQALAIMEEKLEEYILSLKLWEKLTK